METRTAAHLASLAKLSSVKNNPALKLHMNLEIQNLKGRAHSALKSQNDHQDVIQKKMVKGFHSSIECLWCFVKGVPKFSVKRRKRGKNEKKSTKLKKFVSLTCKVCKKPVIKNEPLPALDAVLPVSETSLSQDHDKVPKQEEQEPQVSRESKKKKKKKDKHAGLVISESMLAKSAIKKPGSTFVSNLQNNKKLLNLFQKKSKQDSSTSRLESMLK